MRGKTWACAMALAPLLALGGLAPGGAGAIPPPSTAQPAGKARAGASTLRPFTDCAQLRRWYVRRTVHDVGPYGWRGNGVVPLAAGSASGPERGVGNSATGTNTQEAGVDEPDVAKTDGSVLARVRGRRVVLTDVTGDRPQRLGSYLLPLVFRGSAELLLAGDRLLVAGGWSRSRLIVLDISDPAHPVRVGDLSFSGSRLALRQYGDTVRLVVQSAVRDFHWVHPQGHGKRARALAKRKNRRIVRHSGAVHWLPRVRDHLTGEHRRLVRCRDVLHPRLSERSRTPSFWGPAVPGTVTVVGFDAGSPTERSTVAAVTDADAAYSSADHLYLAETTDGAGPIAQPAAVRPMIRLLPRGTRVDGFTLTGITASYLGSRRLAGQLIDRWSMDEHDGDLRLALTWPHNRHHRLNSGVVVLRPRNGRLARIGAVQGLGRGEDLKSVRWFDHTAFLVTFRQIDPLFAVDLTDPTRPRVLGRLKTPGFSSYLHPVGGDRLLGIGTHADRRGRDLGSQAAVFDVADLTRPVRLSRLGLGRHTDPDAAWDPRAFTWLPDAAAAITTVTSWSGRTRTWLLRVSPDGTLTGRRLAGPGGSVQRALPLADGRVALVGKKIVLVDPATP